MHLQRQLQPLQFQERQLIAGVDQDTAINFAATTAFFLYLMQLMNRRSGNVDGRKELKDFPDCGERNDNVDPGRALNECTWTCSWMDNPYYRQNKTITITRVDGTAGEVDVLVNLVKIPTNLDCMLGCSYLFIDLKSRCTNYVTYSDCHFDLYKTTYASGSSSYFIPREIWDVVMLTCYLAKTYPTLYSSMDCESKGKNISYNTSADLG